MAKVTAKRSFAAGRGENGKLITFKKGKSYDEKEIPKNCAPYFTGEVKKKGALTTQNA